MSVFTLDRTTWIQVNTVARRLQVRGGRIKLADSATPAADDFTIHADGAVMDVTAPRWAQAHDPLPAPTGAVTIVISQTP
jgi:hypothetical protein